MEQVKEQEGLASAGTFCPNKECPHYAEVEEGNLIKYGRSKQGVQRYRCKICGTTFAATRGTLFYRKHAPLKDILETLALLAEGVRISSLSRAKGFKEDTILRWLREAARHSEAVEEALLADYEVSKAQVDGLWAYVGNKGEKMTCKGR
jgi:transposase-like protein